MAIEHIVAELVDALSTSTSAEIDRARGLAAERRDDYSLSADKRESYERLYSLLRQEMGEF